MKRAELDTQIVHLKACLHYKKELVRHGIGCYIVTCCRQSRDLLNKHIFTVLCLLSLYPYE